MWECHVLGSPRVDMGLDGVEIFTNSSASYHELRKADHRVILVKSATTKDTVPFVDCVLSTKDTCIGSEVCAELWNPRRHIQLRASNEGGCVTLGLEDVRSHRGEHCHPHVEYEHKPCHRVKVDFSWSDCEDVYLPTHQPIEWQIHTPEEEIRHGTP
ncbi:glutamine-dependent NAD(+) synthetase-like [Oncorhynchus mykiss]|uniref:glutamine-dependent NAD(+) synthetase-like n=1 Tax=Oncorhynchus mykiss TaxID=8022 RepID=UPI001878400A|nr:glutamine-dependent NAD(+) synthetase-like [Oncorhynchus mykiss]